MAAVFSSKSDSGSLPFLCKLVGNFRPLANVLSFRLHYSFGEMSPIFDKLLALFGGIPTVFLEALHQKPLYFCLQPFLELASSDEVMAELLAKGVPLFLRPDLEEAEEVVKQLKIAAEMGPTVGIGLYLGLTKKGPKRKFSEFLETVIRLPSFEKLGHLKNRLGNDCLKWAEELDEQQQDHTSTTQTGRNNPISLTSVLYERTDSPGD